MARLWKTLPAFLLALVLAVAVACGGGGSDDATKNVDGADSAGGDAPSSAGQDDGGSLNGGAGGDLFVSSATEALGASVESFSQDINSVRAEFLMHVVTDGTTVGASGEFAFKNPDELYMVLDIESDDASLIDLGELGTFEVLFLGDDFYMNIPIFGGWFVVPADELGAEFGSFESLLDDHSPFDYQMLVDSLGDSIEDLGVESFDGGTFRHFQVSVDADDVYGAFAESFGESDTLGIGDVPADVLNGPMVMDIWVHADSFLPHKLEASASFDFEGETSEMTFSVLFTDYNTDFDMPDPPEDAQSFEELFGGFFEEAFEIDVEQTQ